MTSPDAKPTSQAESPTAPELSAQPQLAVRRAGRFFCDHMRVFSEWATVQARNRKWNGSLGDEWVYARSRWKAKMEIPVQMLTDPAGSFQR